MIKVKWGKRFWRLRKPGSKCLGLMRMFKLPEMMIGIVLNRKTMSQIQKTVLGREKCTLLGKYIMEGKDDGIHS